MGQWQGYEECGTLAGYALGAYGAAVLLEKHVADVEAETEAWLHLLLLVDSRRAVESLEDMRQDIRRDTDAVVAHSDARDRTL